MSTPRSILGVRFKRGWVRFKRGWEGGGDGRGSIPGSKVDLGGSWPEVHRVMTRLVCGYAPGDRSPSGQSLVGAGRRCCAGWLAVCLARFYLTASEIAIMLCEAGRPGVSMLACKSEVLPASTSVACVVMDGRSKPSVWVCPGRSKPSGQSLVGAGRRCCAGWLAVCLARFYFTASEIARMFC